MKQWRIQGGQFGATTPSNGCGVPLKWHPSDKNAPLFVAYRSRNKDKITQSKLNNALHFVELQDSRGLWPSLLDRDGFRKRGALGHLSFWGPTQVWPIWPFVQKAWKYARLCVVPLQKYIFWLWFYDGLRSSTDINKPFPTFLSRTNGSAIFSWNLQFFRVVQKLFLLNFRDI